MSNPRSRPRIPVWRKLIYALVTDLLLLAAAEGTCRLVLSPADLQLSRIPAHWQHHRDLDRFMALELAKVGKPKFPQLVPAATMRVPAHTPGTFKRSGIEEVLHVPPQVMSTNVRRVLVFGGSAVFGVEVEISRTFPARLQVEARAQLGDPTLEVLNMGRTGWELASVVGKIRQVVSGMRRKPEVVVLYSGNNETMAVAGDMDMACRTHKENLYLYWVLLKAMARADLQHHLHGLDRLQMYDGGKASPQFMVSRLWRPCGVFEDASFWPTIRAAYVEQYRKNLEEIVAWLRQQGILVLLVAPPVNLVYFTGAIQKQPVSYRKLGRSGYEQLSAELAKILEGPAATRLARLEAFVRKEPTGSVQWYALALELETQKQYSRAARCYRKARNHQFGAVAAMPDLVATVKSLRRPGVLVVETDHWFPKNRAPHVQAEALFLDVMHPRPEGHKKLAEDIGRVLLPRLKMGR